MLSPSAARRLHGVALILLLICCLAGCDTSSLLLKAVPPGQLASVHNGTSAVALARVDCARSVERGIMLVPSSWRVPPQLPSAETIEIELGDSDSAGAPRWSDSRKDFRVLSKETSAQGWFVLIKPPGYYYLHFVGLWMGAGANLNGWATGKEPTYIGPVSDPLGGEPTLRIELPPKVPLYYVGTFHVDCPTYEFGHSVTVRSSRAAVEDETEAATAVAHQEFPSLPPPVTRLAVRQSGPILLGVPPADSE